MTAYLIEHPPAVRQFRDRGTTPSGLIVVHTAENTPDWVGPDAGAEAVAGFIRDRTTFGSYHWLVDSDSIIDLVPLHLQAYGDGTGSNPFAIHVSAATQAAKWPAAPREWTVETIRNMAAAAARSARWLKREHGITVPAKRITLAASDDRKPGFIAHAGRDPQRRSDPGASFDWDLFLTTFSELLNPQPATPNITAFLAAKSDADKVAAARKIIRSADDAAVKEAQRWLTNRDRRVRSSARMKESRTALKRLEVKK
jgi:hypothetical protein